MKLKHPKITIAYNLLSILGWVILILSIKSLSDSYAQTHPMDINSLVFVSLPLITMYSISIGSCTIAYILECIFETQINNTSILNNKVYSYFFDLGLLLYALPILWLIGTYNYVILQTIILIGIYILFKIIQFAIKKIKNKQ